MRLLTATLIAVFCGATSAQSVFDDFNRPNSSNMGPDWSEQNGDLKIESGHGVGNFAFTNNWMYHTGYSASYQDAFAGVTFNNNNKNSVAVGLVIGLDPNAWSGVEIKLQDNDGDKLYDRLFFEAAINAGAWFNQPTPVHYDLPTPLASGRLTVHAPDADTAEVQVFDINGNLVGTYQASGITQGAFPPVGDRVGLIAYGNAAFDDFFAKPDTTLTGAPETLSVAAGGVQSLDIAMGSSHASELYYLLGSTSGTTPGTYAGDGVTVPLNLDSYFLHTLANPNTAPLTNSVGSLDANGQATALFTLPPALDPALVGMTVHHAAVTFGIGPMGATITGATDAAPLTLAP